MIGTEPDVGCAGRLTGIDAGAGRVSGYAAEGIGLNAADIMVASD